MSKKLIAKSYSKFQNGCAMRKEGAAELADCVRNLVYGGIISYGQICKAGGPSEPTIRGICDDPESYIHRRPNFRSSTIDKLRDGVVIALSKSSKSPKNRENRKYFDRAREIILTINLESGEIATA